MAAWAFRVYTHQPESEGRHGDNANRNINEIKSGR